MSIVHWANQANGAFGINVHWIGGLHPGPGDDAILDAAGSIAYTVTSTVNQTVNSIQMLFPATLDIASASDFNATSGSGSGVLHGLIKVEGGSTLEFGGNLNNAGAIQLGTGSSLGKLLIHNSIFLNGAGQISLSNKLQNFIGGAPGATLTNVDNIIIGSGYIGGDGIPGDSDLTIVNRAQGVFDAIASTPMILQTPGHILVNQGLIEATGSGNLRVQNTTVDDTPVLGSPLGAIAAAGANVYLFGAHVIGGSLSSSGAGAIHALGGAPGALDTNILDGTHAFGLTNNGLVVADDNSAIAVMGAISNLGTLRVDGTSNTTELQVAATGASLSGSVAAYANGGSNIVLTNSAQSEIIGATASSTLTLSNWQTISGQGQVGGGRLTLVLNPQTFIHANATGAMVLSMGAGSVVNNGLIEASGTGGLKVVDSLVTGSGSLSAYHGTITLQGARLVGQDLESTGIGVIISDGALLDGRASATSLYGALKVASNSTLTLEGALTDSAASTLTLGASTTFGTLLVAKSANLSGGGQVILSDNGDNTITATFAGATLTNVDNAIAGAGLIGGLRMAVVNKAAGVINANGNNTLTIDTAGMTLTNGGLLEATGTGGLALQNVRVNGSTGGMIKAGNGSVVTLRGATLVGGTLGYSGTGLFQTIDTFNVLDGRAASLTNAAEIAIQGNTRLTIEGGINNAGSIYLNSVGGYSFLTVGSIGATLSGGGIVTLSDVAGNIVVGANSGAKLTNVDNTISGSGQLGQGQMWLVNQAAGVINANGAYDGGDSGPGGLVIDTGGYTVANAGLIEATGSGGMTIKSVVSNTGTLRVGDGAQMILKASVSSPGLMLLAGSGNGAHLNFEGVTLSGAGSITLSDDASNSLSFDSPTTTTNYGNSISGAGDIDGALTERNGAVINATGVNNSLVLQATVINKGLIEATGPAGLDIESTINDTGSGVIDAKAGSIVRLGSSAVIIGGALTAEGDGQMMSIGATLDGAASAVTISGTLNVGDSNYLSVQGNIKNTGSIAVNTASNFAGIDVAAQTSFSGGGSILLNDSAANYLSNGGGFTNINNTISGSGIIASDGVVTNRVGGVFNASGAVNALTIQADTFMNGGLIEATGAGGGLVRGNVVQGLLNNIGVLEANGGLLRVGSAVTGTGTGVVASGTLQFENSFNENVSFTGLSGTLTLFQSQTYTGSVSGFTHAGGTFLDLRDIGFVSAGEATFVGDTSGGILTVTDGVHSAQIHLSGDYTGSTFVASDDAAGGVMIHDPAARAHVRAHALIQAMSSFSRDGAGQGAVAPPATSGQRLCLSLPSAHMAA
jgi:hypothetical protein